MKNISWKEVAAVVAVGVAASMLTRKVKVSPVVAGTALYTAGYLIAMKRPAGGFPMLAG